MPKLFLSDEGMDLEDVLETLLSESSSINPRKIKGEGGANEVILGLVLKEIIAHQKPIIEVMIDKLKEKHAKIVDQSYEVDDEKESFEVAKVSGDISQARIRNYGKSCVKQRS